MLCTYIKFVSARWTWKIKDVIYKVRENVKYINHNDARLKAFCDVIEQKGVNDRMLILDCSTRWNSTYHMLSHAIVVYDCISILQGKRASL